MDDIPSWGRVVARPHEFLVQMRQGRIVKSGQGMSCFKWPRDSVAILPTSIAKLSFVADQVTREKVGVAVTGLAVYRIAEPLLAYRMFDLDRMSLENILRDMFTGATRRIVAGLTIEECLTHRKERVAAALMTEISPVLAGEGGAADGTSTGWGVILDTVEIQDVKVLSEQVFSQLQAPFRESLALEALGARDKVVKEQARLEAEQRRLAEQARRELMAEEEARMAVERRREAEGRTHQDALLEKAQAADLARRREKADADRARASVELAAKREAGEVAAELVRLDRGALGDLSEARLTEILLTETMPKMATAFRGSFDKIHVTSTNGSDLYGFLSAGLEKVVDVVQATRATRVASE
jgi:flotillin